MVCSQMQSTAPVWTTPQESAQKHLTFCEMSHANSLKCDSHLELFHMGLLHLASATLPLLKPSSSRFRYFEDTCGGLGWRELVLLLS